MVAVRARFAAALLIVQLSAVLVAAAALVVQMLVSFPEREVMGWAMGVGLVAGMVAYSPVKAVAKYDDDYEIYAIVVDIIFLLLGAIVIAVEMGGKTWLGAVMTAGFWALAYCLSSLATNDAMFWFYIAVFGLVAGLSCALMILAGYVWFATGNYSWTVYLGALVFAALYGLMAWRRFFRQVANTG